MFVALTGNFGSSLQPSANASATVHVQINSAVYQPMKFGRDGILDEALSKDGLGT